MYNLPCSQVNQDIVQVTVPKANDVSHHGHDRGWPGVWLEHDTKGVLIQPFVKGYEQDYSTPSVNDHVMFFDVYLGGNSLERQRSNSAKKKLQERQRNGEMGNGE